MSDEINEKDLPPEGNSNGRIYPPVEKAKDDADEREDDPMQPAQGDAAAVRDGGPSPNGAE
jgi:hypothetical protein